MLINDAQAANKLGDYVEWPYIVNFICRTTERYPYFENLKCTKTIWRDRKRSRLLISVILLTPQRAINNHVER